ncbi:protein maelstrom homolog [Pelodytes ibericus]
MPNKKAGRNAYFFFVLDMLPELRRRGLEVSGVKEAIPHCSEYWALLTEEEKEKYAEKARKYKNTSAGPVRHNISPGVHAGGIRKQEQWKTVVARTDGPPAQPDASHNKGPFVYQGLDKRIFYFINIFSHGEMPPMCEQRFVPCEIGCVRYSLRDGIMGSFHDFIDPGELPRWFRYHCQAGSAATHQIPISGFELANNAYHSIFCNLFEFVCAAPSIWPPLYCKANDAYRIKWCLQWLAQKAGMENKFELFEVESLIIKLYRDKLEEEPSRASVCRLLDVVQWDYANNTRCKWHEENDMWYCALASCKKMTYCISKALASVYGITITPAHLPSSESDHQSANPKIVVLDAKRYQSNRDPKHYGGDPGASGNSQGNFSDPRGFQLYTGSTGRGRGILRLLETNAVSQVNCG